MAGVYVSVFFALILGSGFVIPSVFCSKILVLPGVYTGSHFIYLSKVGELLANAGHDVTLLLAENHNDLQKTSLSEELITFEKYHSPMDKALFDRVDSVLFSNVLKGQQRTNDSMVMLNAMMDDCGQILQSKHTIERLRSANFDIVVLNGLCMCNAVIAQKLSLPFVSFSPNRPISPADAYYTMPSPLSYVPTTMTGLTDKMNFLQRLKNVVINFAMLGFMNMYYSPYYQLKKEHDIKPEMGMMETLGSAELYLFGVDWAFEFPRPTMPNVVLIGSLMAKETKPLDSDWEDFINSADNGIVVFSFGSMVNPASNMEVAEMLTSALARLPQKVVMRYDGEPPKNLGNNTKLAKWMPQNDILGNPRTRAFVGHGGINGVFETLYHGVPMVGIPLYGDHYDNLARLVARGMAQTVNMATLTSDELYEAITTVIEEPSYKENAMRLSAIQRDTPMSAGDTAVYWIEYAIKHGGQHLKADAFSYSFITYFSLDVLAFLAVILFILIFILKKLLNFFFKLCRKQRGGKEKTN